MLRQIIAVRRGGPLAEQRPTVLFVRFLVTKQIDGNDLPYGRGKEILVQYTDCPADGLLTNPVKIRR